MIGLNVILMENLLMFILIKVRNFVYRRFSFFIIFCILIIFNLLLNFFRIVCIKVCLLFEMYMYCGEI